MLFRVTIDDTFQIEGETSRKVFTKVEGNQLFEKILVVKGIFLHVNVLKRLKPSPKKLEDYVTIFSDGYGEYIAVVELDKLDQQKLAKIEEIDEQGNVVQDLSKEEIQEEELNE